MRLHRSLPLLGSALLASPAMAQAGDFDAQLVPSGLGSSYLSSTGSTLGRLTPGDLDGNGRQDLVLREGNNAVWVIDPGFYDANDVIAENLTGGAVAPPLGTGSKDRFVAADAAGLSLYTWNSTTHAFDSTPINAPVVDWGSAKRLQVGMAAGDKPFIVAYSATNSTRLLVLLDLDDTQTTVRIDLPAAPLDDELQDVAVLDFDGLDGDEIFVSTLKRVYRFAPQQGASLIPQKNFSADYSLLEALHRDGATDQLVCAFKPENSVRDRLFVVDAAGVSTNLLLPAHDRARDMATGDLDADGNADLAVAFDDVEQLTYFQNQVYAPSPNWSVPFGYQAGTWRDFDLVPSGASGGTVNYAEPAIIDADNDGDNDLFFPLQTGSSVAFLRNAEIDHTTLAPAFAGDPGTPNDPDDPGDAAGSFAGAASGDDVLEIFFDLNSISSDNLEWSLWYLSDANLNADQSAFAGNVAPLSQDFGSIVTSSWTTGHLTVNLNHSSSDVEMFFIEARPVGSGVVDDPTVAVAFSLNTTAHTSLGVLFPDAIDGRPIEFTSAAAGGGSGGGGGGQGTADPILLNVAPDVDNPDVGVVTLIPRLPKFPPDVVPDGKHSASS